MFRRTSDKLSLLLGFAIICLAALASLAWARPATNEPVETIRQLEDELANAVVAADVEVFDRLLADDFTHTSHSGRFRNKAEWIADLRRGGTKYATFKTDDMSVRVYGDAAVVTSRSVPTGTNSRGQPIEGQYRYLRVWVKRDANWQVVAFQGTRIADGTPLDSRINSTQKEKQ